MSDRMDAVLASIDQALTKCICGNPIPENGPSLDYCTDVCQYRYTAQQAGAEPDGELLYPVPPAETDGRAINNEVNAWFDRGNQHPPWAYYEDDEPPTRPVDRYTMSRASYHNPPSSMAVPMHNGAQTAEAWGEAMERFQESLTIPADELRESLLRLGRALTEGDGAEAPPLMSMGENDDAQPTPEEFRRRALEARQNRGTGPQRRDNRRWRNT